jgi:hypothetical protein
MKAKIVWYSRKVLLAERIYLFCFGEKCQSSRIEHLQRIEDTDEFEIDVTFIESEYFKDEIKAGNHFTINETALRVLGRGIVM